MSELLPISDSAIFYQEAAKFRDDLLLIDNPYSQEQLKQELIELINRYNNKSTLIGVELIVESDCHTIDWSYGEAEVEVSHERVAGTFEGRFIGYCMLPYLNSSTGIQHPALGLVLDTNVHESEFDYYQQILVATPIPSADIRFV